MTTILDTKTIFASLDKAFSQLLGIISSTDSNNINIIPTDNHELKESWTAAQVMVHITKSNKAIRQSLKMEGKISGRDPGERAAELKKMFLDFTVKFQSPEFIIPEKDIYQKEILVAELNNSVKGLKETAATVDLSEIISLPAFGEITKFELLHFVLYHTRRHIHQVKNILRTLESNRADS